MFIGRLDSYKRLDWLIEALAGVRGPWQLLVVGDGPRRAAFELLCRQRIGARSGEQVRFLGRLSEEAKQACLATADVLVLPSDRSTEAFGIVQLEAMAAGIPAWPFSVGAQAWVGWGNCLVSPGRSNLKICVRCCRRWRISRRGGFSWGSKPVCATGSSLPVRCG